MCGIIGIVGKSEVGSALYDALTVLQHRGQDAAGIATIDGDRIRLHKGSGLVRDVFTREAMLGLRGNVGIGHCRYPTAGSEGSAEAQPLYVIRRNDIYEVRRSGDRCAALLGGDHLGDKRTQFRCVIYDDRPRTCREFTLGSEHCLTARRRVGLSL